MGMKKLVEGTGGTSAPEVEGREEDDAECPDELEGMGLGWAMLGAADRGPQTKDRQAYNDVQARWGVKVERAHRPVSMTARTAWKN